ncbi:amino acid/amide ABC transporter substrate-binding protein, HAAT family (TC 3.A.1.4.-) [Enhydrobacter aerosaccus]|uniref:Amino acid/amide ABC transporter substrate-binding protein, HAAT family (TC 3.A.1.4.-) n=1 Tax=Enhydrobacter aerosaccus TaxID=225324 RepID=A0A1T4RLQ7_9HYPH|nr:ABC transporter substrate-binding protein [Enhydrobacter aerosaccus]SKA16621.1 amino acid/amide ABC transporter substrate-binding protein, HAAT family (TC 3.A.1.4.-) [Enhydrobacter aerosaccus]
MTNQIRFTRRHLGRAALAGAAVIGAPLPLRHALAQSGSGDLKVAVLLPTSGTQAQIGQACKRGSDVANAVFADMKMPVKLDVVNYDTETKPDVARTQAEKAIEAGAHVLIGAFDSGQTIAIAQVAEQRGIPLIVNIAAAPQITEQGYKFVVRNFPTAPMLISGAFALHKEIFKASGVTPKTAVLMSINDTFGTSMVGGIKAMFPKLDMPYQLVDIITYDPAAKDLSVEVAKAKATKADMLMPVSRLNDAKLMIQEMVKQRWEPMAIMNPGAPGLYEQDFLKTMGKYGDFHISNVPWLDPKSAMTQSLEKQHAAKFASDQLDLNGGFTFEAMLIAAQAWLAAKSTKADALMAALRGLKIDQHVMVGGPIQFDAKGQNVNIVAAAVQNLKRKPTVVMPKASAAADLVFPEPGWNDKRRT